MFTHPAGESASVLDGDAGLLEAVPPEHRDTARRAARARVLRVERGPWDARHDAAAVRGELATLPFEAAWRALDVLRLAILDPRWSIRMAQFADVGIALCARAMLRSRRLANTLAIATHPRLDERLRLLLWEFADRYGNVHPDGVHLRLPLTHEVLAELAAARRPSVSTALGRLTRSGQLDRRDDLWVLHGEPPAQDEAAHSFDLPSAG